MQEDRFFTYIRAIVRRVLDDADEIDYKALYPAVVVKWQSDGLNPSGTVDVNFSDARLKSATSVPVLPPWPGINYVPRQGTQCVVGWQGGDERYPYATGWRGEGGASRVDVEASTEIDVVAPTVQLGDTSGLQLVQKPVYDALVAFASTASSATTAAQIAAAAATLNTALTTPPLPYTTKTKAS